LYLAIVIKVGAYAVKIGLAAATVAGFTHASPGFDGKYGEMKFINKTI